MRVTKEELNLRVHQVGLPAAITGRHDMGDGDPAGGGFGYFIIDEEALDKQLSFAAMLDIKDGSLQVARMHR